MNGDWRPESKALSLFVRHGKLFATFWGAQRANRNRFWPRRFRNFGFQWSHRDFTFQLLAKLQSSSYNSHNLWTDRQTDHDSPWAASALRWVRGLFGSWGVVFTSGGLKKLLSVANEMRDPQRAVNIHGTSRMYKWLLEIRLFGPSNALYRSRIQGIVVISFKQLISK